MNLICRDFQSSISLPDNCTEIITSFIKKKIPYYVFNDIINVWYESFKRKIKKIIDDNKFDQNWYDLGLTITIGHAILLKTAMKLYMKFKKDLLTQVNIIRINTKTNSKFFNNKIDT